MRVLRTLLVSIALFLGLTPFAGSATQSTSMIVTIFAPAGAVDVSGNICELRTTEIFSTLEARPTPYAPAIKHLVARGDMVREDQSPVPGVTGCVFEVHLSLDPADSYAFSLNGMMVGELAWSDIEATPTLLIVLDASGEISSPDSVNATPIAEAVAPTPTVDLEATVQAQAATIATQEAVIATQEAIIATQEADLAESPDSSQASRPHNQVNVSSRTTQDTEESYVLQGTLSLFDGDVINLPSSGCMGTGGFDDFYPGAVVTIRDGNNNILATGRLEDAGTSTSSRCDYEFEIELPRSDFYQLSISHRSPLTYTFDELVQAGWEVELSIG